MKTLSTGVCAIAAVMLMSGCGGDRQPEPARSASTNTATDITVPHSEAVQTIEGNDVLLASSASAPLAHVVTNSIGIEFRLIEPGNPGSATTDLPRAVYFSIHEITQSQYESVTKNNPSQFEGGERPVEKVSWQQAVDFCRTLSATDGKEYRLPSQAEWQYACRAGTSTKYSFGDDVAELPEHANYADNSRRLDPSNPYDLVFKDKLYSDGHNNTAPVGSFKPNPWGLYDMHGNVAEWCTEIVCCGGSWYDLPDLVASDAYTTRTDKDDGWYTTGFRVVLETD